MKKNEVLSRFLKESRKKLGKSQHTVSNEIGCHSTQYNSWETKGRLPRDPERQERIATALGVTREALLELKMTGDAASLAQNIIPLIKAISQSNCAVMHIKDLEFLTETQSVLNQPMSPALIEELMKCR